jgi:two-component system chemotaxis sensor kinase CheA
LVLFFKKELLLLVDELLEQFIIEGRELVAAAADDLLAIERDPAGTARIDGAFRAVHTLKGSVGLFDFAPMGDMLHAAEDVLSAVRAGRLAAARPVLDALLECIGTSEDWIDAIARDQHLPADAAAEAARLSGALRACEAGAPPPRDAIATPSLAPQGWVQALLARAAGLDMPAGTPLAALHYVPASDCFVLGDDPLAIVRGLPGLVLVHVEPREPWRLDAFDPFRCNLRVEALSTAPAADIQAHFRTRTDQCAVAQTSLPEAPSTGRPDAPAAAARSMRIDAGQIDALSDLVGELVVAKNRLAHAVRSAGLDIAGARTLAAAEADIDRLTADMQRTVLRLRMVPLASTFRRCARVIRDVAARLGKELTFDIEGEEVEADKAVADALFEPLLHVLRNAVDHGIEAPETRRHAGKKASGHVVLSAVPQGEQMVIAVRDDGGGLDPARLRQSAVASGFLTAAAAAALDDAAANDLVFAPGFSTAKAVTSLSGRGVGLDAVRSAVEALGGRVGLNSAAGEGTVIRMVLPRAVIVTTAMAVRAGGGIFGIPMEAVAETARIPVDRIHATHGGNAFVLRERTIPLLRLAELLGLPYQARQADNAKVVIMPRGDELVGVEVDGFDERVDVLLRPLTGLLAGMPGLRGTALMGDGNLMMILDVMELAG